MVSIETVDNDYVSISEAARILEMSRSWADNLARTGVFNVVWFGEKRKILRTEIIRMKQEGVRLCATTQK
jgi:hypothetical protein